MEMKSVTRSLRILEAVAQHQPVTVGELTKLFGLPKSTVQRTLVTLSEAGWLRANRRDTTRWEIGARVLAVRPAALQGSSLFAAAREPMIRLRDTVNETIHLSVPDALQCMVVVDRVDCDHAVRTYPRDRRHLAAARHSDGTGRPRPPARSRRRRAHRPRAGAATASRRSTDPPELRAELERVRTDGYSVNRNQYRPGRVRHRRPHPGRPTAPPLAAVAISMPDSRYDAERVPEWAASSPTRPRRSRAADAAECQTEALDAQGGSHPHARAGGRLV